MAFDWHEYLTLAKALAAEPPESGRTEIVERVEKWPLWTGPHASPSP